MNERNGWNAVHPTHEEMVDSRAAAAFLGVHYKTLEKMARMGQIPAMKAGKPWQFLLSLLSEWRKERMNSNLNKRRPRKEADDRETEDQ